MEDDSDLFESTVAAVIPKEPFLAVEDGERLVTGVVIPLVFTGTDDRVERVALPIGNAVARPGEANLGVRFIAEADVEHQVPVSLADDLTGRDLVLFPNAGRVGNKDGVGRVLRPFEAVRAGRVANGVGFILFTTRIPH